MCRAVDCNYMYVDEPALITGFTVGGESAGDKLTITGNALPTSLQSIYFGDSLCSVPTE